MSNTGLVIDYLEKIRFHFEMHLIADAWKWQNKALNGKKKKSSRGTWRQGEQYKG